MTTENFTFTLVISDVIKIQVIMKEINHPQVDFLVSQVVAESIGEARADLSLKQIYFNKVPDF